MTWRAISARPYLPVFYFTAGPDTTMTKCVKSLTLSNKKL
jgi:hypothetical protein